MREAKQVETYTKGMRSSHPDYIWGWNVGHTLELTKEMPKDDKLALARKAQQKLMEEGKEMNAALDYLDGGFVDGYNTKLDEVMGIA